MSVRFSFAGKCFVAAVSAIALVAGSTAGQTIILGPMDATAVFAAGQAWGGHTTTPVQNPTSVSYFYSGSYVEYPVTVESPGMYDVLVNTGTPLDNIKAQVHVRQGESLFWYASPVTPVPNSGDPNIPYDYAIKGSFTVTGVPIMVAGTSTLRVRNVTILLSTNANREPSYENDTAGNTRYTGFDMGEIVLTRTGDLPPMGVISGQVTSADLGGVAVPEAFVMTGTEPVPEPGPMWQRGFWTTTDADGRFMLPAFTGEQTLQAGSPAMMAWPGVSTVVTVSTGATTTQNLSLASRGTTLPDGRFSVQVECEMFIAKNIDYFSGAPGAYDPSPVVIQGRPLASNGFNAGYIDIDNWVELPVYIPKGQGGEYLVSHTYFNGYWDGVSYPDAATKFIVNGEDSNSTVILEPNTAGINPATGDRYGPGDGYSRAATLTADTPVVLKEGYNLIRVLAVSDLGATTASAWDAFTLTQKNAPVLPPGARQALRIAAGLEAGPTSGAVFDGLNVAKAGASATAIDMLDAVTFARDGKL